MLDQESFWEAECFAVITDGTRPAMSLTAEALTSRGKRVYIVDLSDQPEKTALRSVSQIPEGVDRAVIGVSRVDPAGVLDDLQEKGIGKIWLHWRMDTKGAKEKCTEYQMQCVADRCPMMYLSQGLNMHTIHQRVAKLLGKY